MDVGSDVVSDVSCEVVSEVVSLEVVSVESSLGFLLNVLLV